MVDLNVHSAIYAFSVLTVLFSTGYTIYMQRYKEAVLSIVILLLLLTPLLPDSLSPHGNLRLSILTFLLVVTYLAYIIWDAN